MHYLAPFALFGSRTALEEGRIESHVQRWERLLTALTRDQLDLEQASKVEKLTHVLDQLIASEQKTEGDR